MWQVLGLPLRKLVTNGQVGKSINNLSVNVFSPIIRIFMGILPHFNNMFIVKNFFVASENFIQKMVKMSWCFKIYPHKIKSDCDVEPALCGGSWGRFGSCFFLFFAHLSFVSA